MYHGVGFESKNFWIIRHCLLIYGGERRAMSRLAGQDSGWTEIRSRWSCFTKSEGVRRKEGAISKNGAYNNTEEEFSRAVRARRKRQAQYRLESLG